MTRTGPTKGDVQSPPASRLGGGALILLGIAGLSAPPANASVPIPFAYTVCVKDGTLVADKGTPFSPREWQASSPIGSYEGQTVRIEGPLAPGGFVARTVTVVAETCKPELLKSEALCNPCLTTLPEPLPIPPPAAPKE